MENLLIGLYSLAWFLVILTVVVFIHEFGHYLLARLNGVHVETFSIGFGKEIIGFNDKRGTRWKISMIPMGGYVKMFGDLDASSTPDATKIHGMSYIDKLRSFHYKSLWRKASIVIAGPVFNYLSAFIIILGLFAVYGKTVTDPVISTIVVGSAAEKAGLRLGDKITKIDGNSVHSFEEVRKNVALNTGESIDFTLERQDKVLNLSLIPVMQTTKDAFGNTVEMPLIGISSKGTVLKKMNLIEATLEAGTEVYSISCSIVKALGQVITGQRSVKQLGGPVKIAQYSGQSAKFGIGAILWFIALISINLGFINLMPLPMLDGGHLAYYAIEGISGRTVAQKFQVAAMKVSFVLLMSLMVFITYNDIKSLIIN